MDWSRCGEGVWPRNERNDDAVNPQPTGLGTPQPSGAGPLVAYSNEEPKMQFTYNPTDYDWRAAEALEKAAGVNIDLSCRYLRGGNKQFVAFATLPVVGGSWECESDDSFRHALQVLQRELGQDVPELADIEEDGE